MHIGRYTHTHIHWYRYFFRSVDMTDSTTSPGRTNHSPWLAQHLSSLNKSMAISKLNGKNCSSAKQCKSSASQLVIHLCLLSRHYIFYYGWILMALILSDFQHCTLQQWGNGVGEFRIWATSQEHVPLLSQCVPLFTLACCCPLCPLRASEKVPIISTQYLFFPNTSRWSSVTL